MQVSKETVAIGEDQCVRVDGGTAAALVEAAVWRTANGRRGGYGAVDA